jgi:hypothetical protein
MLYLAQMVPFLVPFFDIFLKNKSKFMTGVLFAKNLS